MSSNDIVENENLYCLILEELKELFDGIVKTLCDEKIIFKIDETADKRFGDLTCNVAFLLSKYLKKSPYQIATEIVNRHVNPHIKTKKNSFISYATAHQSGYVNFTINYRLLFDLILQKTVLSKRYKFPDFGHNKLVLIEHTSVNPNKAIHVGHLRNIVIGDSLYRIFKNTNYDPKVLNYIDDSGVQVADIIVAFLYSGFSEAPPDPDTKFDKYCGEVYVKITKLIDEDQSLLEKRKFVIREMEKRNSKISIYASNLVKKILKEQLKTCWEIGSRYDILNIESDIIKSNLWDKSFQLLKEKNVIYLAKEGKNVNCWVIKAEEDEDEKVIVRSDGTKTYFAKDIPYALWKLQIIQDPFDYLKYERQWDDSEIWISTLDSTNQLDDNERKKFFQKNPDKAITIIDSRQSRLQNLIIGIIKKIEPENDNYHYLGYEAVTLSPQTSKILGFEPDKNIVHMSGRKGLFFNADDLIEQLKRKSLQEIERRNKDQNITPGEIEKIALGIAVSTIRYTLIKQDLDKIIVFDLNEATNLDGDTSLYLQYAYARASRILEKSDFPHYNPVILDKSFFANKTDDISTDYNLDLKNRDKEVDFTTDFKEEEISLIKELAKFDYIIEQTIKTLNPKNLARYANNLATKFNMFYENVPVLKENNENLQNERKFLVKSFIVILSNVFDLLGLVPLSKI